MTFSGGGASLTGTGTITNDDSATITINSPSVMEGNAGTTSLSFTVSINNPVDTAVTMTANTANVSATAGSDYTAVSGGTVTFAANSTTAQTVNVTVSGDTSIEANETLQLVLSTLSAGGRNVSFSGGGSSLTGTGTINNDDSETLTISSPSVAEGNSGTVNMVFTVTSSLAVQGGFTVAFTLADVTTNSTDHAAFPTGPLTFTGTAGETQTITVVVNGDTTVEPSETLTATLGIVTAATATQSAAISTGAVGTGTIVNDDGNPPTATVNSDPVIVNEGSVATNGGTFSQVDGHAVTVAVALGSPGIVSQIGTSTGSWSWSFTPPDGPSTRSRQGPESPAPHFWN